MAASKGDFIVVVTKKEVVSAVMPMQEHWLPLSNLDLIMPPVDVSVFFCYKKTPTEENLLTFGSTASVLKKSLAQALVSYYPLAGEMVQKSGSVELCDQLLCNNRGVDFTEAFADVELCNLNLYKPDESVQGKLLAKKDQGVFRVQGYQFWTQADGRGNFEIKGIRPGLYNLFAWVPGFIGDYKYGLFVTITSGSNIRLNNLVYEPPRNGPTLWEIGIPDRVAAEFFMPDPNPALVNHLYINFDKFRQYGLWNRYAEIYPHQDLVYNVGVSNCSKDWFFAHVTRHDRNGKYKATTWRILFEIKAVNRAGNYTLHVALASANGAELQVRVNNPSGPPNFSTGLIGKDNAIARHGVHGIYRLYSVVILGIQLHEGTNTIFLTQSRGSGPFNGLMYDYICLEQPKQIENNTKSVCF